MKHYLSLISLMACFGFPAIAQNSNAPGGNWNGSWGFASTSERSLALSQAQTQRLARQPAVNPVTYSTVYNNTTNTNTVGAMNTGDTNVTVNGEGNHLNTTSTAGSTGCLDGSVGFTTVETNSTGAAQPFYFSVSDSGAVLNCDVDR